MAKFCGKCGSQLDHNAVVCSQCRNPINQKNDGIKEKTNATGNIKQGKKIKIIIVVAIITIVIAASIIHLLSVLPKTINLEKYVTVEFSGADGYGKATASIDLKQIQIDYGSKIKKTEQARFYFSEYGRYTLSDAISEAVVVDLSEYEKLSNGDTVLLQWEKDAYEYLSAFNVELSYNNIEYTVEGLSELNKFDAFSYISVTFDGISANGSAQLNIDDASPFDEYSISIDKYTGLSNGDTVTVKIDENEIIAYIESYGSAPTESEKTYTVSGLSSYATKVADISADALDEMKNKASDVHKSRIERWVSPETCKNFEFIGNYFLTAKNSDDVNTKNIMYLVYKITVETNAEKFSYYWYMKYENVIVLPDGSVTIDLETYNIPTASYFLNVFGEGFIKDDLCYEGYEHLDEMYNNCVTNIIDEFYCENTVAE